MDKKIIIALAKELTEVENLSERTKDFKLVMKSAKMFDNDEESFADSELKEEFDKYYSKLKQHESSLNESVFNQKQNLIYKINALIDTKNIKKASDEIKAIVEEFKSLGRLPKEQDDKLWGELKQNLDAFNKHRQEYYASVKDKINENRSKKEELVKKAQEVLNIEDIKEASKVFEELMNEWKSVGFAGKEDDDRLWKEFNVSRQAIYKNRQAYYENMQKEYAERVAKKEDLVRQAKIVLANSEFTKEEINKLKALRQEWKDIGFCGKAKDDELYNEFNSTINKYFDALKNN